jgi:hypothetical protein
MSSEQTTPLNAVNGWPRNHVTKLVQKWITTADQVVAIAATPNGLKSLASQLDISESEMRRLVNLARSALSERALSLLEEKLDASQFGLGAKLPGKRDPKM